MKIVHLINETYQVVDEENTYFQGTHTDCVTFLINKANADNLDFGQIMNLLLNAKMK